MQMSFFDIDFRGERAKTITRKQSRPFGQSPTCEMQASSNHYLKKKDNLIDKNKWGVNAEREERKQSQTRQFCARPLAAARSFKRLFLF